MNQEYIPGEGCLCHAHSEAERYRLDANAMMLQRDRLVGALELLVTTDHESKEAFIERVKQALAAVKGGSHE
jgi:hypothetical protein